MALIYKKHIQWGLCAFLALVVFSALTGCEEPSSPTYTITFISDGGVEIPPKRVSQGAKATGMPTPTRPGFTFAGWYQDASFTELFDVEQELVLSDLVLYANWTAGPYSISFQSGEGGSSVGVQLIEAGSLAVRPSDPVRQNSAFIGWYTAEDAAPGTRFDFTVAPVADAVLHAKWAPASDYTMDPNSGVLSAIAQVDSLVEIPSSINGIPVTEVSGQGDKEGIFGQRFENPDNTLASLVVPPSVTRIGDYAFTDCSLLREVALPNTLVEIGDYAFSRCTSLIDFVVPPSTKTLGEGCFRACGSLVSVSLPETVSSIGSSAFSFCRKLSEFTWPSAALQIQSETFSNCSALTEFTVPGTVTEIGQRGFHFCENLLSVTLPASLKTLGKNAFERCSVLASVRVEPDIPPVTTDDIFNFTAPNLSIRVPSSVVADYQSATGWSKYAQKISGYSGP